MTRPLIAIPGRDSAEAKGHRTPVVSGGRLYADAVLCAGGLPVLIPPNDDATSAAEIVNRCDGLLLMGGGDVSPTKYGQTERTRLYGVNEALDNFELAILNCALERGIPILAICRGHQVLNVALGGTLIQHIDTMDDHLRVLHEVQLVPGSRTALAMGTTSPVTHSSHHQAIDTLGAGLTVVGTHHDGTIEAVELEGDAWVVGVQWHPEDTAAEDPANQGLFDDLVSRAERN